MLMLIGHIYDLKKNTVYYVLSARSSDVRFLVDGRERITRPTCFLLPCKAFSCSNKRTLAAGNQTVRAFCRGVWGTETRSFFLPGGSQTGH